MSCPAHRGRCILPASICGPSVLGGERRRLQRAYSALRAPIQSDGPAATEGEDAMNVLRGKVVLKETSVVIPGL